MAGSSKRHVKRGQRPGKKSLIGKTIDLDIRDMAHGGSAMGKFRGRSVLVPYALPGEAITAEITEERGSLLIARGLQLKAASADRAAPQCPHFGPGRCWGCQWQHIDYRAQLLLKQDVLADQLSRAGGLPDTLVDAVLRPVVPAEEIWRYNQVLTLRRNDDGEWGLRRQQGRDLEPISDCHLSHIDLPATLAELDLDFEFARRLTLQRGSDGRIMLIFKVGAEQAPTLHTDLPLSVNMILPDNVPVNLIGDAHSVFDIKGRDFRVTAGAAIRPNINQIEPLIDTVLSALQLSGNERVLDLYAGVGIFSAFMAAHAQVITLVESYPPAVSDADVNLRDFDNIDVIEGQVEAVLADMLAANAQYDVALVDPPSSGIHPSIIKQVQGLQVRRLAYVSGDPTSLARDCKQLFAAGFRLRLIQAVDMAPQTYYITTVAYFER